MPLVSVILPVFNSQRYLASAVGSILDQSFRDFEFIIIDDGSTDRSLDILRELAASDSRIRLISRPNTGYTTALNEMIALATGEFVARMDADDISLPDRFDQQVRFLQANPQIAVVGTFIQRMDPEGQDIAPLEYPVDHDGIDRMHIAGAGVALAHPAVMMRAHAIRLSGGYRKEFEPAEDYDLWLRLAERWQLANIPRVLLRYRLHAQGQCLSRREQQWNKAQIARAQAWQRRGLGHRDIEPVAPAVPGVRSQWARIAHRSGQYANARKLARKALWREPCSINSWRVLGAALLGPHAATLLNRAKSAHRAAPQPSRSAISSP
jgi:glycosyltransferase involved in cell wall biosynthesis